MSTIDERVVSMKLNNSQFESNARKTLGTLKSLGEALKLDKAASGLASVASAAKNFRLGGIGEQVDKVSASFSALSVIGVTALATLTSKAVSAAASFAKSFTIQPIADGFSEYETKLGSIQTILANTSRYGTKLPEVTANLEELNKYADKTIYNFGDMTRNIGLFTNAGIGIGDATSMIKGFSNVAAASGTNAQGAASAAYQLSQALSAGTIRLMDWKSLTNVGMGNKNMQNDLVAIAEKMGAIKEAGTSGKKIQKDFNASLKDGWLKADVMSMYLKIMAEDNEKLNRKQLQSIGITGKQADAFVAAQKTSQEAAQKVRTFTQLIGTIKEGIGSGWAKSFEILFGDFNTATTLFTGINDKVGKIFENMSNSRNALLSGWSKLGGRAAGIEALGNIFEALAIPLKAIKDAFQTVFPPKTAADLANMTKSFRDFTETLKMGPENADRMKRIFTGLFTILKVGVTIISAVAKTLFGLFGIAQGGTGGFLELAATIADFVVAIEEWLSTNNAIKNFFKTIDTARMAVMVPLMAVLGKVAEAFSLLFKGDFAGFKAGMKDAFMGLGPLIQGLWTNATKGIRDLLGNVKDAAGIIGEFFTKLGNGAKGQAGKALTFLGEKISWVSEKLGQLRDFIGTLGFKAFSTGAKGATTTASALGTAGQKVKDVLTSVKDALGDFFSGVGSYLEPLVSSILNLFTTLNQTITKFLENLDIQDAASLLSTGMFFMLFKSIKDVSGKLGGFLDSFSGIGDGLTDTLSAIKTSVTDTFSTMQKSLKADILLKIAIAIGVLAASLWVLSRIDPKALTKAMIAVGALIYMLNKSMNGLLETMDSMENQGPLVALNILAAGSAIMLMAAAVLLLSFAVSKLSKLSWEEMAKGLISVGVLIAALTLFTKYATLDEASFSASVALIAMAAAALILSVAVEKLAKIDTANLIKGTVAVAALITVLTVAANALQKMPTGMLGLVAMAIALGLLVPPLVALSMLDLGALVKGVGAVSVLLLSLAIAAVAMGNPAVLLGGAGMILLAAALTILIVPLMALGLLPYDVLKQGLVSIAILLGGLVVSMLLMANPLMLVGAMSVGIIAVALSLLVAPITALGLLPFDVVKQGLLSIALVIGVLAIGGIALVPASVGFMLFGAALVLIGTGALMAGTGMLLAATALGILVGVGVAGITLMSLAITTFASLLPLIATQIGLAVRAFVTVIAQSGPEMVRAFSAIISALLTAIISNTPKFYQAMDGLIKGLLILIRRNLPSFLLTMDAIIKGMLTIIQRNLPQFLSTMGQIISGMLKLIRSKTPEYTATMTTLITGLLQVIRNVAPRFYSTMGEIVMGMVNKIRSLIPQIAAAGVSMILRFLTVIQQAVPQIARKGTDIMIALINAIAREVPRLADAGAKAIIKLVNGVANAIRNNQPAMNAAGKNLASAIINGMTGGLFSGVSKVTNAAKSVAGSALSGAKNLLGIRSPSREFAKLGKYSSEGFALGLNKGQGDVKKSIATMQSLVTASLKASVARHRKLQKELKVLENARRRNPAAIRAKKLAIKEALAETIKGNRAHQKLRTLKDEELRLKSLNATYDRYTAKIKTATEAYDNAVKVRNDYKKSVNDQFDKLPDFSGETKLPEFINSLEKQIVDTQVFNAQLKQLEKLGLNKQMYMDIVAKGTDSIPFVTQILDKGKNGVNQLNTLEKALGKSAANIGQTASAAMYQAGVYSAAGLLAGLKDKRANIGKAMENLASRMVISMKKALGIRSPSREFAKIGAWSTEGLVRGFENTAPIASAAAGKMGDSTLEAFRKSLSGLSEAVAGDIDMDPTIRPILDLSAIKKDASQIGGLLGAPDIKANASYSDARNAAANYRLPGSVADTKVEPESKNFTFNQYNNSPKALSEAEIYRNTKNQISTAKGALKI